MFYEDADVQFLHALPMADFSPPSASVKYPSPSDGDDTFDITYLIKHPGILVEVTYCKRRYYANVIDVFEDTLSDDNLHIVVVDICVCEDFPHGKQVELLWSAVDPLV